MLPKWVKRLGITRLIIVTTIVSMMISIGMTSLLNFLISGSVTLNGTLIGAIVPLIITPLIGSFTFRLLFELDEAKTRLIHKKYQRGLSFLSDRGI